VLVKVATPMKQNVPSCSVVQWYNPRRGAREVCVKCRLVARGSVVFCYGCSVRAAAFVPRCPASAEWRCVACLLRRSACAGVSPGSCPMVVSISRTLAMSSRGSRCRFLSEVSSMLAEPKGVFSSGKGEEHVLDVSFCLFCNGRIRPTGGLLCSRAFPF
jgi:hypothetical protein